MTASLSARDFYERHVLPQFALPYTQLRWHGRSTLGDDSSVYYFSIDGKEYLLVFEAVAGTGRELLSGNVIAPHQTLKPIPPKDERYSDIYIQQNDKYIPDATGYFSLFQIISP